MAKTIIQLIKAAASKLRGSKLERLGSKEISATLNALSGRLGFSDRGEAIVFTAIFDRVCSSRSCDLDDMASYFDCTHLDMMEYIPALRSLLGRGLILVWNSGECNIVNQNFQVPAPVMNCLLDDIVPSCDSTGIIGRKFDRYDFCKQVNSCVQDSESAVIIMQATTALEETNSEMTFVKDAKAELDDLSDRILFYELCYDFYNSSSHISDLDSTLEDIFDSFGVRIEMRRRLIDGSSVLITKSLVELSGDGSKIMLTEEGQQILLEEDYDALGASRRCRNRYDFSKMVSDFFHDSERFSADSANSILKLRRTLHKMESQNSRLSCVGKAIDIIPEESDRALFYIICARCPDAVNLGNELRTLHPTKDSLIKMNAFKDGKHILQKLDLAETKSCSSFFGEYTAVILTDKGKELFFEEDAAIFQERTDPKNLIHSSSIQARSLFFSEKEQAQLSMVGSALEEINYQKLVSRLEAKGLSKGIAVLLYGAPGTGKTESVMQWARATGRDIVHVDLSASKSMWYGESEKIVKEIFTRYRNLCKRRKIKPILLFNEADGLFSKRKDSGSGSSVDQTENTIQNIILEEMENLDGILIATTNLAGNLDSAFERRFLFKIRLDKPAREAKMRIWQSKIPALSGTDAARLAADYDFSGGEIDNIVRKATMQEVLTGNAPSIEFISSLCSEEKIGRQRSKIGF